MQFCPWIYFGITDFLDPKVQTYMEIIDIVALVCLGIAPLFHRKFPLVCLIVNLLTPAFRIITGEKEVSGTQTVEDAYLYGNITGVSLAYALLSIRKARARAFIQLIIMVIRIVIINRFDPLLDSILLFMFYVQRDRLERQKFKEI